MNPAITYRAIYKWSSTFLCLLFLVCSHFKTVAQPGMQTMLPVIPLPAEMQSLPDSFIIDQNTTIYADTALANTVSLLNLYLAAVNADTLKPAASSEIKNGIVLVLDSNLVKEKEGYHLSVHQHLVRLAAHDAAGIVYGIQTLRQLWSAKNDNLMIPGCIIADHPRFAYRGMALDVSRHFFAPAFIKKYIDLLSLYKFNSFHWHLTDDQGWRIEIKQYPRLQTVASWRNETLIGHKKELPHRFDGRKYGGYYTQEEIKDIVQYATQRNITIIPEIEMPGHALAALTAYPQLGCTGGPYNTATFWGVFDDVFCAGNDSTFSFLEHVLDEVITLFPSQFIHIGGDECPKTRWQQCPKCQQRMHTLGLKDERALQSYFIGRVEKYVNGKGRNIIGWDEILEGGLAPNATVMSWRGEEGGIAAAQQQHQVIMTPESHVYFDYYQSLYKNEPLAAGGYTPLQKVYNYEPAGGNPAVATYLKGLEAQAWSEYFTDTAQAEYMIFPRAIALAEIAWTASSQKNFTSFLSRVHRQQALLNNLHVNADFHMDDISYQAQVNSNRSIDVNLQSVDTTNAIDYTLDGNFSKSKSSRYSNTIRLTKNTTIKAGMGGNDGSNPQRIFQQDFYVHKAIGARVSIHPAPVARFNTDPSALVNGVYAGSLYNDNQWLGFSGDDMEASIDLGSLQTIQSVTTHFLNYHWQKMWAPSKLVIAASADGVHYKNIYTQTTFPINGINPVTAKPGQLKARFIKVNAYNKGPFLPENMAQAVKRY